MWLGDRWREFQAVRAQRYLARYPALGIAALRQDAVLAAQAFDAWSDQDAARTRPGPARESYPWPVYGTYAGRTPVQRTLPKPTPISLRRFSEHPPARRAINCLSNPILELPFAINVRAPNDISTHDDVPAPTAEQQARISAATEMFWRPNDDMDWRECLEMMLEDLIVLGAGPFEVQPNTSDPRPLFFWPVDAQSIRINMQWTAQSRDFRYSQGKGYLFTTAGTGDDVKFQDLDLCYPRLNPRTSTPFGLGYMEVAYEAVNSFVGAFQFATRRASNETPAYGLFLGEHTTPEQAQRFRHYWETEVEGMGRIPILGGGRAPAAFTFTQGTGKDPLWLAWQEQVVRTIAMAFGISPMRLGLERDINKSTASQGAADDWMSIAPVANVLRNAFTHWILWKRLGWTDLEFQWQVKSSDELRQAQILSLQYKMNAITIDELRQIYERPPLPDGLGDMTCTPFEAMVKRAAMPEPVTPEEAEPGASETETAPQMAAMARHPFGDIDQDLLSPAELAFVRALMARLTVDDLEDAVA